MPHRISTASELAARLEDWPTGLFAIDGYPAAGKSTLAKEIAGLLHIPLIHLDDFLVRGEGGFIEFIKYSELSAALNARPVIVEGVCLLAVAKRLGMAPDVHIYVEDLSGSRGPRAASALGAEILTYHQQFRPAETADILYLESQIYHEVGAMRSGGADIDIAYIAAKTKLALFLACGGMLTLLIGLAVLLYGVTSQDEAVIRAGTVELSASGLGGVIMITSVAWAFFAYKARPTYARVSQSSEEYDAQSRLIRRHQHESATDIAVSPSKTK